MNSSYNTSGEFKTLFSSFSQRSKEKKKAKLQFLHFTNRRRQNQCMNQIQQQLKNQQSKQNVKLSKNLSKSFDKKFVLRTNHLDLKSLVAYKQQQSKNKKHVKLKKKAILTNYQNPCVGMYEVKPQFTMRKLTRNGLFSKSGSLHTQRVNRNCYLKQKSQSSYRAVELEIVQNKFKFKKDSKKQNINNCAGEKTIRNRKVKTFDMSKQTSRGGQKVKQKKISQSQIENDYLEKNFKKKVLMRKPMSELELNGLFSKYRNKYKIPLCKSRKSVNFRQLANREESFESVI